MSLDSILTQTASALGSSVLGSVTSQTAGNQLFPDLTSDSTRNSILKSKSLLPEYACFVVCNDRSIYVAAALPESFSLSASSEYDRPFADTLPNKASILGGVPKLIGLQPLVQALTARFWSGSSTGAIHFPIILQAQTDEVEDVMKPYFNLMALNLPSAPNGLGSILRSPGPSFSATKATQAGASVVKKVAQGAGGIFGSLASGGKALVDQAIQGGGLVTQMLGNLVDNKVDAAASQAQQAITGIEQTTTSIFNGLDSAIKNKISVQIGKYMIFDNVVIKNVSSNHKIQPVGGLYGQSTGNMQRIEVELEFEPFFDMTIESFRSVFLDKRLRDYAETLLSKKTSSTS